MVKSPLYDQGFEKKLHEKDINALFREEIEFNIFHNFSPQNPLQVMYSGR